MCVLCMLFVLSQLKVRCIPFMVEAINEEVLKLFRTLHVYVYMHGSAGTNGLFLPNGSSVVEIMPFAAQVIQEKCF